VKRLATYDWPPAIVRGLKREFGITVRYKLVHHYHPERVDSRTLAQRWRDLFWKTRQAFIDDTADIGAGYKPVRIRWRGEFVQETWDLGQYKIANDILDSIAKETGGASDSRHKRGDFGLRGRPLTATVNIIRNSEPAPAPEPAGGTRKPRD
jgi:hypothetical protein